MMGRDEFSELETRDSKKLQQAHADVQWLEQQIEKLQNEVSKVDEDLDVMNTACMRAEEELTHWKTKVEYMEAAADQEQSRQHESRKAIQECMARIKILRDSRSDIKSEAADKMVEMARAVGQKSEAMLEAALKQNLKSLEDELQSLADKRTAMKDVRRRLLAGTLSAETVTLPDTLPANLAERLAEVTHMEAAVATFTDEMLVTASYLQDTLREAEERLKGIRDETAQLKEWYDEQKCLGNVSPPPHSQTVQE